MSKARWSKYQNINEIHRSYSVTRKNIIKIQLSRTRRIKKADKFREICDMFVWIVLNLNRLRKGEKKRERERGYPSWVEADGRCRCRWRWSICCEEAATEGGGKTGSVVWSVEAETWRRRRTARKGKPVRQVRLPFTWPCSAYLRSDIMYYAVWLYV